MCMCKEMVNGKDEERKDNELGKVFTCFREFIPTVMLNLWLSHEKHKSSLT